MVLQNSCLTSSAQGRGQHTGMTSTPRAARLKLVITDEISDRAETSVYFHYRWICGSFSRLGALKEMRRIPIAISQKPAATPPDCLSFSACSVRSLTNLTGHLCHQWCIAVAPSALILCKLNQHWSYSAIYTDCQSRRISQWQLWVPSVRTWAACVLMYV